jgi:starch synthase (maltosyl-transferring)
MNTVPTRAESAVIERVTPQLDGGRFPAKRAAGQDVLVEADVFKDGHDVLAVRLQWRVAGVSTWEETTMTPVENDRWRGVFCAVSPGWMEYRVAAGGDSFASWRAEIRKKADAGYSDLSTEAAEGALLLERASGVARGNDRKLLRAFATAMRAATATADSLPGLAEDPVLDGLMAIHGDRSLETTSTPLRLWVDRPQAACGAWYEFFPRSAEGRSDGGSTFRQCVGRVEDARAMGFDVIYFPPIHPIGITKRKGRNNSLEAEPEDPGVPYAIGNRAQGVNGGGHMDVAPELGTLEDFEWLVGEIRARGMEVALDFAINCSPDHPYVTSHPDWFFHRPDGSIKYAENPPKKYEDVYPLNFHNADWRSLWEEMRVVLAFWCARGVRMFRVDNPHTKPVAFWEWVIAAIQRDYPDAIFLSEAFTKPKMMKALAKAGFTQSYTYFTWRNTRHELEDYLTELTCSESREYFRPNFFANTPDILPFFLQSGGRPAFCIRAILAATLSPVYGIYSGFELCENHPVPGREEYLDSEKYQFKGRDWNAAGNIKELLTRLNAIRRQHRCLRELTNLHFHPSENDQILFFSKSTEAAEDVLLIAVNLDPFHRQTAFVTLPLATFGIGEGEPFLVEDLLWAGTFRWVGSRNFIALDPQSRPAHVFRLRRRTGRVLGKECFA